MPTDSTPELEHTGSRQFTAWLAERDTSLAFTTYRAGKLFLVGLKEDGALSVYGAHRRSASRPTRSAGTSSSAETAPV